MNDYQIKSTSYAFFGANSLALKTITNALKGASTVRIATAYFEPSGYQCLKEVLRGKEVRLLVGRPDTGSDKVREVIHDFMDSLMSAPAEERTETILELRDALQKGLFLVSVSADDISQTTLQVKYLYQHAKLYMNDRKNVVVTSANMTNHGLVISREAGIIVSDPDDVNYFVDQFDKYYKKAKPIAEDLLAELEAWLKIYSPFIVYARSLIELYGLPDEDVPVSLPILAGYQRPVVSRVLRNIEDYNGVASHPNLNKTPPEIPHYSG